MTTEIVCEAVIIHKGKVLLTKSKKKKRGWLFPGGHLEEGELPEACVAREVKEETNLDVDVGEILNVYYLEKERHADKRTNLVMLQYPATPKTFDLRDGPEDLAKWFSFGEIKTIEIGHEVPIALMKIGFWKEVQTCL